MGLKVRGQIGFSVMGNASLVDASSGNFSSQIAGATERHPNPTPTNHYFFRNQASPANPPLHP
jgi:hypothetical protein